MPLTIFNLVAKSCMCMMNFDITLVYIWLEIQNSKFITKKLLRKTKYDFVNFISNLCTESLFLCVCTKCYTSAISVNMLLKYQLLLKETTEGFHETSSMGKGEIQRSWWNIQCFMSKATVGKEAELWAEDGKAGLEGRNQVRRHFVRPLWNRIWLWYQAAQGHRGRARTVCTGEWWEGLEQSKPSYCLARWVITVTKQT